MESYHISDDRTVSVVKLQDGEKIVNMKVNKPFEKSIDLTYDQIAETPMNEFV